MSIDFPLSTRLEPPSTAPDARATAANAILFVDDEPNVLSGLRRMSRSMRDQWDMEFVASGAEALARLDAKSFAIVVTDMRMPGMDGASLLKEVAQRSPQTVRIILSGQSDQAGILKAVDCAHQFLPKPCDQATLLGRLSQLFALRDQLANPVVMRLSAAVQSLPTLPSVYQSLVQEIHSSFSSVNRIGEIMSQDIALSAKLLKMSVSSFFGALRAIGNPTQAATRIGFDIIKSLVLGGNFSGGGEMGQSDSPLDRLTRHSVLVGARAKAIAQVEHGTDGMVEGALVAGMLHDLGYLVLVAHLPEQFARLRQVVPESEVPSLTVEEDLYGATHPQIGACLLGLWGLPPSIVEAVAYHHEPQKANADGFNVLTAVHVADAFSQSPVEIGANDDSSGFCMKRGLDMVYIKRLGLADRVPVWRVACGLAPREEST